MSETLVLQSHAAGATPIIERCTETVRAWAAAAGFGYRLRHDELFEMVSDDVIDAARGRMQMAADIARLAWIAAVLDEGASRVIWLDADVLIFAPEHMSLDVDEGCLFGREIWVQPGAPRIRARANVHNAILVFTPAGRVTLDFYFETATRMLTRAGPDVPPQFVGPKLLTALHNVVALPLTDAVGMASPLVIRDLAAGDGPALDLLAAKTQGPLAGLNLCSSLIGRVSDGVALSDDLVRSAADRLMDGGVRAAPLV